MKHKDLKTGVVYRKTTGTRKAVIVSLDQTFERPNSIIEIGGTCIVREGKGANKGYLVVQAGHNYPDEALIADAAKLALPVVGKVWPYIVVGGRKTKEREGESVFRLYKSPRLTQLNVEPYGMHKPEVSIWLGTQIAGEFAPWIEAKRKDDEARQEVINAVKKQHAADEAAAKALMDRAKELNITGVRQNIISSVRWRGVGGVDLSNEMFEALLNRAS